MIRTPGDELRDLGKVRSLLAGRTNVTLAHVADARQISGQAGTK